MRPLRIAVVHESFKILEAVDPNVQRVKPLSDADSHDTVELTAQSDSREGSQIAVAIDEKHRVAEAVLLAQSMHGRSGWISVSTSIDCDIEILPDLASMSRGIL
jgi:hypothetical protein